MAMADAVIITVSMPEVSQPLLVIRDGYHIDDEHWRRHANGVCCLVLLLLLPRVIRHWMALQLRRCYHYSHWLHGDEHDEPHYISSCRRYRHGWFTYWHHASSLIHAKSQRMLLQRRRRYQVTLGIVGSMPIAGFTVIGGGFTSAACEGGYAIEVGWRMSSPRWFTMARYHDGVGVVAVTARDTAQSALSRRCHISHSGYHDANMNDVVGIHYYNSHRLVLRLRRRCYRCHDHCHRTTSHVVVGRRVEQVVMLLADVVVVTRCCLT